MVPSSPLPHWISTSHGCWGYLPLSAYLSVTLGSIWSHTCLRVLYTSAQADACFWPGLSSSVTAAFSRRKYWWERSEHAGFDWQAAKGGKVSHEQCSLCSSHIHILFLSNHLRPDHPQGLKVYKTCFHIRYFSFFASWWLYFNDRRETKLNNASLAFNEN